MAREKRNWKDPVYSQWRKSIRERDGNKCQWPGCESKSRLQVHHIKTWGSSPSARFDMTNGITLCKKCHDSIKGKEKDYEMLFHKILEWNMLKKIKDYEK